MEFAVNIADVSYIRGFTAESVRWSKTGNVRVTKHRSSLVLLLLQWKNKKYIYSECVFVSLHIQHVIRMRHIVMCGPPRSTIFFHIIS